MNGVRIDLEIRTADGIPYDDVGCLEITNPILFQLLCDRDCIFITRFGANGTHYGGRIIAANEAAAREVAFGRGLGETIVGRLKGVFKFEVGHD